MGIDFSANYGIGYEVCAGDEIIDSEEMEDGLGEYLYNQDIGIGFEFFDENEGYDTEVIATYLIIKDPFTGGLDLTEAKMKLDKELIRLELEPIGNFKEVGGMYVY
jgi:hypothetical protein